MLGVFVTVYDFLIRVIPVYVLGVFATVYDFLIRVIPVYVLGVFAIVYDFLTVAKTPNTYTGMTLIRKS